VGNLKSQKSQDEGEGLGEPSHGPVLGVKLLVFPAESSMTSPQVEHCVFAPVLLTDLCRWLEYLKT